MSVAAIRFRHAFALLTATACRAQRISYSADENALRGGGAARRWEPATRILLWEAQLSPRARASQLNRKPRGRPYAGHITESPCCAPSLPYSADESALRDGRRAVPARSPQRASSCARSPLTARSLFSTYVIAEKAADVILAGVQRHRGRRRTPRVLRHQGLGRGPSPRDPRRRASFARRPGPSRLRHA
jgi:hypothetical protein